MRATILLCVLAAAGCATGETSGSSSAASSGSAERADEPGSTRASREAAREEGETDDPSGATSPAPSPAPSPSTPSSPSDRPVLSMHPADVDEAEDGHGETVKAPDPVAFDVDGRRFPPRAADPVLIVGDLRFRRYTYPRAGVLRFVAADRDALPKGEPVFLRFGDDERTREKLADSLEQVR